MAKIRTVKPEFWHDEKLSRVSRDSRLFFISLFSYADDRGRMVGVIKVLRGVLFPYDDDIDIPKCISELISIGAIYAYEVDDHPYLWIVNFEKHQKIDKRTESRLPAPSAGSANIMAESPGNVAESPGNVAESAGNVAESAKHSGLYLGSSILDLGPSIKSHVDISETETDPHISIVEPVDAGPANRLALEAKEVFEHWAKVMKKQKAIFDSSRKSKVLARLRDGYTVEDLKKAIDGCSKNPYNMGQNADNKRWDDLELICRSAPKVDQFIGLEPKSSFKMLGSTPHGAKNG